MGADEVVAKLNSDTLDPASARRPPSDGGVPAAPGVYAWWVVADSLPSVSGPPHPREHRELLYVGIAPSRGSSSATLRSRVVGAHLGGNIGGSTFRMSLCALLVDQQRWHPYWRAGRPLLTADENRLLTAWQAEHLTVSWAVREEPWLVEGNVIEALGAPLNLAENKGHPFHPVLSAARCKLRQRARRSA